MKFSRSITFIIILNLQGLIGGPFCSKEASTKTKDTREEFKISKNKLIVEAAITFLPKEILAVICSYLPYWNISKTLHAKHDQSIQSLTSFVHNKVVSISGNTLNIWDLKKDQKNLISHTAEHDMGFKVLSVANNLIRGMDIGLAIMSLDGENLKIRSFCTLNFFGKNSGLFKKDIILLDQSTIVMIGNGGHMMIQKLFSPNGFIFPTDLDYPRCLCALPGKLAVGTYKAGIKIWPTNDINQTAPIILKREINFPINSIALLTANKLASLEIYGQITIWDLNSRRSKTYNMNNKASNKRISPDAGLSAFRGSQLIACNKELTKLCILDSNTMKLKKMLGKSGQIIDAFTVLSDSQIAIASTKKEIDKKAGKEIRANVIDIWHEV